MMLRRWFPMAAMVCVLVFSLTASGPATAQYGGRRCQVIVFWDANFQGEQWRTTHDSYFVGQHWNDQISSIQVLSGVWEFYWDAAYKGEVMRLGPGSYGYVGDHWNDQISSFRCVGG